MSSSNMHIAAEWVKRNIETVTREELIELIQLEGWMTFAELRHWIRTKELERKLSSDQLNMWLYLSKTGWLATEELEEWLVIHTKLTADEMIQWFRDVEQQKLQTEEEREMARECMTIQQLVHGRERLHLEKELNKEELRVWLPYRGQLGAPHLNEWLELRPWLVDEEKSRWCRQRRVSEQSVAWMIAERGVLAERFSRWLSETLGSPKQSSNIDYRSILIP